MRFRQSILETDYLTTVYPLVIEQLFMMLIGNVNVFLFSLYNDQFVAAIGLADQVLAIGGMALGIVSLGGIVLLLRHADEDEVHIVQRIIRQCFILIAIISVVLALIYIPFAPLIMNLIQSPANLLPLSIRYLRLVSLSLVFQGISMVVSIVLRSHGKVKSAMFISLVNTIFVIVGNALVILTPDDFIQGGIISIALMTIFTRFLGSIFSLINFKSKLGHVFNGLWQNMGGELDTFFDILKIGFPSGMENISYNFSQAIITAIIASLGTVAVTSKIYTQTITAIVFTISVALGQGGQIIIGRFVREKVFLKAKDFLVHNLLFFSLISFTINVLIALSGNILVQIFTDDPVIIRTVRILLVMSILYDACRGINEIVIAGLQVVKDVKYPVFIGVIVTYLFTIPFSYLTGVWLSLGIIGVWLIFILDEGLRAILFYRRWKQEMTYHHKLEGRKELETS